MKTLWNILICRDIEENIFFKVWCVFSETIQAISKLSFLCFSCFYFRRSALHVLLYVFSLTIFVNDIMLVLFFSLDWLYRNCLLWRTLKDSFWDQLFYDFSLPISRHVHHIRRTAAAIKIQAAIRGWVKRVQYKRLVYTVTQLQAHARGAWAREKYQHMRRVRAVSRVEPQLLSGLVFWRYKRKVLLFNSGSVKLYFLVIQV